MTEEKKLNTEPAMENAKGFSWGKAAIWTAVIAILAIVAFRLDTTTQGRVQIGEPAPDFTLYTFEGEAITLSELRGKVVLINFWASWCNPCEEEAPWLQQAWEHYEPGGEVMFLGIDWSDSDTEAAEYLEKYQITYPNGVDLRTAISQDYRTNGVPETYIVDREGVLREVLIGPYPSIEAILADIDAVLAR